MLKRRVHLHGKFAAYHDGPIEIFAATVWDAVEAVTTQVRGFLPTPVGGRQTIQVAGFATLEDLKRNDKTTKDIHIFPALAFGKDNGLIQTLIGVTLVVVGFALGGPTGGFWAMTALTTGASMIIGGVMQMISPQPQLSSGNEDAVRSKYLPSGQNTVAIGTPIPLLYGKFRIGGHIMSLNIDATDTGI